VGVLDPQISPEEAEEKIDIMVSSVVSNIQRIYSLGYRSFLYITDYANQTPPRQLVSGVGYNDRELAHKLHNRFLTGIRREVPKLEGVLGDANVMLFDLDKLHDVVTEWPEVFGITEGIRYTMVLEGESQNSGKFGFR